MDFLVGSGYLNRLLEDAQELLIPQHPSDSPRSLDAESTLLTLKMPASPWRRSTLH